MRRALFVWFSLGLCLLAAASCGKKKSQGGAEADAGEQCLQVGQAQTGCVCSSTQPLGLRTCGKDFVWSPCMCRASVIVPKCIEGQDVICVACPGESQGRTTKCLTDGTFDCGCDTKPGTGGTSGGGGSGSGGTGGGNGSGGKGQTGSGGSKGTTDAGGEMDAGH